MPGNDFEKQVQQKMDELNFVPSDAVWHEVEKQIAPRKRRRLLVWLPFLGLLLGGAAWMYYAGTNHTPNKKETTDNSQTVAPAADKKQDVAGTGVVSKKETVAKHTEATTVKGEAPQKEQDKPNTTAITAGTKNKIARDKHDSDKSYTKANSDLVTGLSKNRQKKKEAVPLPNTTSGVTDDNKVVKSRHGQLKEAGQARKQNNDNEVISMPSVTPDTDTAASETVASADNPPVNAQMPDTLSAVTTPVTETNNIAIAEKPKDVQPADSEQATAKNKNTPKGRKLEWGLKIAGGRSSISQGVTSLFKSAPAYDINSSNFYSSPSNSTGGSNNAGSPSQPPSEIRGAFGFSVGGFISVPVDKKLRLMAGLHYGFSSTRITVGNQVYNASQTALNYRTGSSSNYTNQFHFIELPFTLQKLLGKTSRFAAEGGFALSWLAGSRALLYDASQNQYVSEKSYINKFQVNLLAGGSYRLFPARHPIEIGPWFSYGLSNMFRKDRYGNTHLFFAGVQAKVFLSKK